MINLQECTTLQIMPEVLRKDIGVQAASYALWETAHMMLEKIDRAGVYGDIDVLPEQVVDLLAEELRAQYYDTTLKLKNKKKAVKKALPWHCKAGTVSAVEELTDLVWESDSVQVQEWFQYESAPYLFRILLETNMSIDEDKIEMFLVALWKVKNTRSHLESITFKRKLNQTLYYGTMTRNIGHIIITDVWKGQYLMDSRLHNGTGIGQRLRLQIREV
ncbi:MAG: hypothetical protein J6C19_05645 [Lachnospiraceae bacterium]|nr:hypothetical protein [Lachnospiraceae bacterium]